MLLQGGEKHRKTVVKDRDEYVHHLESQIDNMQGSHATLQSLRDDIYSLNTKHTETRNMVETLARAARIRTRTASSRQDSIRESLEQLDSQVLALEQQQQQQQQHRTSILDESKVATLDEELKASHIQIERLRNELSATQEKLAVSNEKIDTLLFLSSQKQQQQQQQQIREEKNGSGSTLWLGVDKALEEVKTQAWSAEQTCTQLSLDMVKKLDSFHQQLNTQTASLYTYVRENKIESKCETNKRLFSEAAAETSLSSSSSHIGEGSSSTSSRNTSLSLHNKDHSAHKNLLMPITFRCERLQGEVRRCAKSCEIALRLIRAQSESIMKVSHDVSRLQKSSISDESIVHGAADAKEKNKNERWRVAGDEPQENGNQIHKIKNGGKKSYFRSRNSSSSSSRDLVVTAELMRAKEVLKQESERRMAMEKNIKHQHEILRSELKREIESLAALCSVIVINNTMRTSDGEAFITETKLQYESSHNGAVKEYEVHRSLKVTESKVIQLADNQRQLRATIQKIHDSCLALEDSVKFLFQRGCWLAAEEEIPEEFHLREDGSDSGKGGIATSSQGQNGYDKKNTRGKIPSSLSNMINVEQLVKAVRALEEDLDPTLPSSMQTDECKRKGGKNVKPPVPKSNKQRKNRTVTRSPTNNYSYADATESSRSKRKA
eukprot:jgi/Bigna1/146016/aug1.107_g20724